MSLFDPRDDFQPLFVVGKVPVHAATLLVALHCMAFIGFAIAGAQSPLAAAAIFRSDAILEVWRFVTYAFVPNLGQPIWFAIGMYLLYAFGRELEKFFGRRAFLSMYGLLVLAAPCVITALGVATGRTLMLVGSSDVNFAVFVAFATLYPNVQILFMFRAKWVAVVLVGISAVQDIAYRNFIGLTVLFCAVGLAYVFVRQMRGAPVLPEFPSRHGTDPTVRMKPPRRKRGSEEDPEKVIDALLDKISKKGFASLTAKEREKLESARTRLMERDRARKP